MASKIQIILEAKNKLGAALGAAQSQLGKFGASVRSAFSKLSVALLGTSVSIVGVATAAVRSLAKQRQSELALIAANRSLGDSFAGVIDAEKTMASEIQKATGIGDEEVLSWMARLRALGVARSKLGEATKAIIALKQAGQEEEAATKAVAMAYGGNWTALARLVPAIREAGTQQEKMAALMKFSSEGMARQSESLKTLPGAWDALKGSVGDFLETLGAKIMNVDFAAEALIKARDVVDGFSKSVAGSGGWLQSFSDGWDILGVKMGAAFAPMRALLKAMKEGSGLAGFGEAMREDAARTEALMRTLDKERADRSTSAAKAEEEKKRLAAEAEMAALVEDNKQAMDAIAKAYEEAYDDKAKKARQSAFDEAEKLNAQEMEDAEALQKPIEELRKELAKLKDEQFAEEDKVGAEREKRKLEALEKQAEAKKEIEKMTVAERLANDRANNALVDAAANAKQAHEDALAVLEKQIEAKREQARMTVAERLEKAKQAKEDAKREKKEKERFERIVGKRATKLSKADLEFMAAFGEGKKAVQDLRNLEEKAQTIRNRAVEAANAKALSDLAKIRVAVNNTETKLAQLLQLQ